MNVNFDLTFESQFDVFEQFCQAFRNRSHVYRCDELKMDLFLQQDIRAKYAPLWNDFVSIRTNLLNGILRQLFENKLNVNQYKVTQFYKYFSGSRRFCLKLPINGDNTNVSQLNDFDMWMEMIEKFNGNNVKTRGRNELEHIYKFIVLWNGIFGMMNHRDRLLSAIKDMKFNRCVIKALLFLACESNVTCLVLGL